MKIKYIVLLIIVLPALCAVYHFQGLASIPVVWSSEEHLQNTRVSPKVTDPSLRAEIVYSGLNRPTDMAFLAPDDILVLEKNNGTVQRIENGKMMSEPLLDVNVANEVERCMCGIAISKFIPGHIYVYLYYTETQEADGEDVTEEDDPLGNRLYRYELVDNNTRLANPKLLLDLPALPGPIHNGGKIVIGPDNSIYLTIGTVEKLGSSKPLTKAENFENGIEPDGRSGILRVSQDGYPVRNGSIVGDEYPLNLYYAYGIRNSFGIDFDPITGNLWDTENGPNYGDEINLVEPGFNSGWAKVQGLWEPEGQDAGDVVPRPEDTLLYFDGKGKYSSPEFTWYNTVGITSVKFLHSDKLGEQYENDMFIGDFNNGNIYHFEINQNRTELVLAGPLADKVADTPEETENVIFGEGFDRGITDLEVGNDGYLYVLAYERSGGTIYRILPNG